ncbi:MAG: hypothetical protein AAGB12_09365 [Pseudomonadota bacterium]
MRTLISELKQDPVNGLHWWKVQRAQSRALYIACRRLSMRVKRQDFDIAEIFLCLSRFELKPEDEERARWFKKASDKLKYAVQILEKEDKFPEKPLNDALRELSFIRKEKLFFRQFNIQPVYVVVDAMFNEINERLKEFKQLKTQQLADEKKKAEYQAKLAVVQAEQAKLEQVRLEKEKIEVLRDKRRKELEIVDARRLEAEEKQRLLEKERELKTQDEARERAAALSQSYEEMVATQSGESLVSASAEALMDRLLVNLEKSPSELAESKDKVKSLIQALMRTV